MIEPGPLVHAQALLNMLQRRYPPGAVLEALNVEHNCYPLLLKEMGWRARPWCSRQGVGKYLGGLPGVEKISPYIEADDGIKDRVRCYQLPLADVNSVAAKMPGPKRAP